LNSLKGIDTRWVPAAFFAMALGFWGGMHMTPFGSDAVEFYSAGKLAGSGHLYDVPSTCALEGALRPGSNCLPFQRPPVYAFALKALTVFPFAAAQSVWLALNLCAGALAVFLLPVPIGNRLRGLFFFPLVYVVLIGQDTSLVLLCAVIAWRLLEDSRDIAGGLVLSLCAIKFHLAVPFPVLLLGQRRYRAVAAAAAGVLVQLGASFLVEGIGWPSAYLAMFRHPETDPGVFGMPTLRGLFFWLGDLSLPAEIVAAVGVVILCWQVSRRLPVGYALPVALAAGVLLGRHAYVYDLVLAFPLIACASEYAMVLLVPVLYMLPNLLHNGLGWIVMQLTVATAILATSWSTLVGSDS
jgi:hypothetical protein